MTSPPLLPYESPNADIRSEKGRFASAATWCSFAFFFLLVVTGAPALLLPRVFIGAGPVVGMLLVVAVTTMVRRIRLNRAYIVITYLDQAARLQLPFSDILKSAARSESNTLGMRLAMLDQMLGQGLPLAHALAGAVPEVPPEILSEISAADAAGLLPHTLRRILAQRRRQFSLGADAAIFNVFYPLFMILFLGFVLLGFLVFVLPKFQEIFKDFRVELPAITQTVMNFGDSITISFFPIALLLFLVLLVLLAGMLRKLFDARHFTPLSRAFTDWLQWYTPLWGGIVRDEELARVCVFLGDTLGQGMPLSSVMLLAKRIPKNRVMAGKMFKWSAALDKGATLGQSTHAAGLPHMMIELLASAERTSSVPEAFTFLASHYRWRTVRRKALLAAAVQPIMVLVLGCAVGTLVLALFTPLIKLIEATCYATGIM